MVDYLILLSFIIPQQQFFFFLENSQQHVKWVLISHFSITIVRTGFEHFYCWMNGLKLAQYNKFVDNGFKN